MNLDPTQVVLAVLSGVFSVIFTVLGWLYKQLVGEVAQLNGRLRSAESDAAKLREEIPTKYAQLGSMERMFEKLDTKLDKLFDRINEKADKN